MKLINLLIMLCISIPILSQSNSDVYLGQWLFQKESAYEGGFHGLGIANDTTIRIKQDLRLEIYSIDSVNWYYSETQVIGYIVNENGDYAGPETGSIIEKGLGTLIKLEENDSFELNLNIERNNVYSTEKMNKKFTLLIDHDSLILENKKEKIKLKMHNKG